MKILRFWIFAAGLALVTAPVLAAEGDPVFDLGQKTYKQLCSHCHGLNLVNPGTSSYDLRRWPKENMEQFYTSVTKGKGNMPAWGDILTEEELKGLWRYVVTRGGKEPPEDTEPADDPHKKAATEENSKQGALHTLEPGTLTACLARNGGVMSSRRSHSGVGLDYEISKDIADSLDLDLEVTWFESEPEEESTPVKETYALLSYGLCDMAPGFALYQPSLSFYAGTRAALPRWDDKPDNIRSGFQVDLKPIAVSDPYYRMEIGLVHRKDVDPGDVRSVADLDGLKLGVEQGTLPGILTLRQGTEAMVREAKTFNPGPSFLWEMENGAFDAALVTVGAYDFHVRQNPVSKLVLDDYRHPLGFNLGIAVLKENTGLLERLNEVIATLESSGRIEELAAKSKVHFAAPQQPYMQARLTLKDIVNIR